MSETISDPNPATAVEANPATDPSSGQGPVNPSGEANGQSATAEEVFGNVDPKTLPPQLKAVYDNMLRGFKEKTTGLSERVKSEVAKATEAFKQKAEWYDKALQDENLVKMINEYVSKSSAPAEDPNKVNLPPEIQEKLNKVDALELEMKKSAAMEELTAFAEAKNDKGELAHPDFDKFHSLIIGTSPQAGEYSLLRVAVDLAEGATPSEKLANGYKSAEATYKAIFEEGRKAGLGRLQAKAKSGTFAPSSANAGSTAPKRAENAMEALEFARQGLLPNRG